MLDIYIHLSGVDISSAFNVTYNIIKRLQKQCPTHQSLILVLHLVNKTKRIVCKHFCRCTNRVHINLKMPQCQHERSIKALIAVKRMLAFLWPVIMPFWTKNVSEWSRDSREVPTKTAIIPRHPQKAVQHWNVAGALHTPNGITVYCKNVSVSQMQRFFWPKE